MYTLSVVISAFNEEENLASCLNSVVFADEIIVVDNSSTDKTAEIAKKYTKHVYSQKNDPLNIDLQKNFGIGKATGDWILLLDADEQIPPELEAEIKQLMIASPSHAGYEMPRKNMIFKKWIQHSLWWPDYQLRLFKKGKGKYESQAVHNRIKVEGETGKLNNPLLHENYRSISQYLQKMDRYTENEAIAAFGRNEHFAWIDAVRLPARDFLKTFFLQEGFKDGFHGLVLSMLQAFYMFLVVTKVWEKQGFPEKTEKQFLPVLAKELTKLGTEFSYWFAHTRYQETRDPAEKISSFIKRKHAALKLKKRK
jgi:glycosyltransferase involved in cell wall biosynthesis